MAKSPTPQPKVHAVQSVGVETLTPEQQAKLAEVFGLKPTSKMSSLCRAERPGILQNMVDSLSHHQGVDSLMESNPDKYRTLAMTFGYQDPNRLNHVGRIEQAHAIQRTIDGLAR